MSIRRIDTSKYKITIEIGLDDFGKRKRITRIINGSKEDANRFDAELREKYYHVGNKYKKNNYTFEQLSNMYIEDYCKNNLSIITIDGYINSLRRINPIIGKKKIDKIEPGDLDRMYRKLMIGENGQILGYCSRYNLYKIVNAVFNYGIKKDLININPNAKANKPKPEYKEKKFYDVKQIQKLLDALEYEPIKYRMLIQLALDSGIRRAELCALKWSDVNLDTRMLSITKSLKVVGMTVEESKPKTKHSIRNIMLSQATVDLLRQYKDWYNTFKKINSNRWIGKEDRIFTSIHGSYMHPDSCTHILRKIISKHNLEPMRFHDLRHSCASLLINAGVDPKTVSDRLGHVDTSITMRIYTHIYEMSKMKCAEKMNDIFERKIYV